jgi:hypothetical protein
MHFFSDLITECDHLPPPGDVMRLMVRTEKGLLSPELRPWIFVGAMSRYISCWCPSGLKTIEAFIIRGEVLVGLNPVTTVDDKGNYSAWWVGQCHECNRIFWSSDALRLAKWQHAVMQWEKAGEKGDKPYWPYDPCGRKFAANTEGIARTRREWAEFLAAEAHHYAGQPVFTI